MDVLDTEVIFRSRDDAVTIGLTTGGWHQMFQAMQMNVWINGRDIYMEPVLQ